MVETVYSVWTTIVNWICCCCASGTPASVPTQTAPAVTTTVQTAPVVTAPATSSVPEGAVLLDAVRMLPSESLRTAVRTLLERYTDERPGDLDTHTHNIIGEMSYACQVLNHGNLQLPVACYMCGNMMNGNPTVFIVVPKNDEALRLLREARQAGTIISGRDWGEWFRLGDGTPAGGSLFPAPFQNGTIIARPHQVFRPKADVVTPPPLQPCDTPTATTATSYTPRSYEDPVGPAIQRVLEQRARDGRPPDCGIQ